MRNICKLRNLEQMGEILNDNALALKALNEIIKIFTLLKLCLASASHNFKRVKITHICLI